MFPSVGEDGTETIALLPQQMLLEVKTLINVVVALLSGICSAAESIDAERRKREQINQMVHHIQRFVGQREG